MALENFLHDQREWYSARSNDELYSQNRSNEKIIRNYAIQGAISLSGILASAVLRGQGIELSNITQIAIYTPGLLALVDSLAKNFQQGSLVGAVKNLSSVQR